jgi:hypothetical protein
MQGPWLRRCAIHLQFLDHVPKKNNKTTKKTPPTSSSWTTCQAMASPSRSGSVARMRCLAELTASSSCCSRGLTASRTSQTISKSASGFTEPLFTAKSRTCP